jgi:GNAT superfamily N-acetyltransferase
VTAGAVVIEPLADTHRRAEFACGVDALDRYFHTQVTQDMRRRATGCLVAVLPESGKIGGYYTLAATGIALADLPPAIIRRLPRYPLVPAARLGRLAVDLGYRGQKLGAALLWDAIQRACRSELMAFALVVDAKDDTAAAFYRHHGFTAFASRPRQLFLPLTGLAGRK